MKYPITFIFLLLCISILAQQEIIYDLDSYKQVNYEQSSLVVTPNGGISGSDNINVEDSDANFLFKVGARTSHTKIINSIDEQHILSHNARFNIAEGLELSASRKVTNRSYSGNKYLKLGYDTQGTFDSRLNQFDNVKNDFKNLKFTGDLGLGFGRIEYINHAWSAVQILQALENNGLLLSVPSHDKITEFADLIGKVRTNRILDFRLRNIEILETTINYLIEEKLIDQLSTMAILIIGDTYQYDQVINRNSGSRLEFTLAPGAQFLYDNTVQLFLPNRIFTLETTGRIDHVSFKNIDVKWMKTRSYGAILEFKNMYEQFDPGISTITVKTARAGLTYNYGYRYLPNLRNNFNLNLESEIFMNAMLQDDLPTEYSNARLKIILYSGFQHYFSPSTQLSINGGITYNDPEFQSGKYQPRITGQVGFTLSQAIF